MRCYALGSQTAAADVVKAFCEGLPKSIRPEYVREGTRWHGGDICVWGLLRGAKELRKLCVEEKTNYYAIDHAYIGRRDFFRVTRNGFQQTEIFDRPDDRWNGLVNKYGLKVKDWKTRGRTILVALSSHMNYDHLDHTGWETLTVKELKKHTDRKILVRKKGEHLQTLEDQLKDAWAVVTHASMVAVDAVIAGVPVFVTGPSVARPMGLTDIRKIESPVHPDREKWFHSLAYAQFTTHEMEKGMVKPLLDEYPVNYDHYGY